MTKVVLFFAFKGKKEEKDGVYFERGHATYCDG